MERELFSPDYYGESNEVRGSSARILRAMAHSCAMEYSIFRYLSPNGIATESWGVRGMHETGRRIEGHRDATNA